MLLENPGASIGGVIDGVVVVCRRPFLKYNFTNLTTGTDVREIVVLARRWRATGQEADACARCRGGQDGKVRVLEDMVHP